jgi:hypothetical protein
MAVDITGLLLAAGNMGSLSVVFAIISIIFGLVVIAKPNIIAYLAGLYFIITGLFALLVAVL